MKAMILAAGLGTRMRPLTDNKPKPLLEVNHKPLIDYHLEKLAQGGFSEVVINHAYLGEQIEAHCGDGNRYGLNIEYSREGEPLETAGGIAKALPLLGDEPFLVINGDIWTDFDFSDLMFLNFEGLLGHLVLVNNPDHNPSGDFVIDTMGYARNTGEFAYTFSGISILTKDIFEKYGVYEGPLAPLLKMAMQDDAITAEIFSGRWFDIGTPQRLDELNQLLVSEKLH